MDCLDAKLKMEPCARGDLPAADRAELDRHIATCEGCRLELELTRAVMGTSSSSSLEDPSLGDLDEPSADSLASEPTFEPERLPQPAPEGPGPPRVLTSQLPEESEESLDLASIHPTNAYDPGAIDLPHTDPSPGFDGETPRATPPGGSSQEDDDSFEGPAMEPPALVTASSAASSAGASGSARASASSGVWDFEPVDVPRTAAPPEESLTFANEALNRKRGRSLHGKRGARLLLWAGGAVVGVGLLGASVWMALAFRDVPGGDEPANVPAVQPPPGSEPFPAAPADSFAPGSEANPGMTAADPGAAPGSVPPSFQAGVAGNGAIAPDLARPRAVAPKPPASKSPDAGHVSGTQPAPAGTSTATDPATRAAKPGASPAPTAEFRYDELAPAPRRAPSILTVEPDAAPGSEPEDEPESREPETATKTTPKTVSSAPIFVPPGSGTSGSGGTSGKAPAGGPAASGPLDRLHLATVTAGKNRDLETLRKLKTSWKSTIRSSTGSDRARSKREYADCLWSIQEITKRDSDRKEALTAYRDYVLYAPAGGADARTVSRMRHLEDILSDPQ